MMVLTSLEVKGSPLACTVYNILEELRSYLRAGTIKTSFGEETDHLLNKLPIEKSERISSHFKLFLVFPLENWKDI